MTDNIKAWEHASWMRDEVYEAIQAATTDTDRALQQADFRLGMSDLGHCHEYARRMILQEPFSDVRDKTAAFLGTVVGAGAEAALARRHPDWQFQKEVNVELPSGLAVPGHPDVITSDPPGIWDVKTKDGLEVIKREGETLQQRFQKHGYAKGALDAGLITADPADVVVGNIFIDRSGGTPEPYVICEPYDPQVLAQIDMWIEDVLYAIRNKEEASRDKPRDWCERFCEYFTNCRLYDTDTTGLIEAPDALAAIDVYTEGAAMERQGKKMKDEAKAVLTDVQGHTATHVVRHLSVGPTQIESYTREGYTRLDIRPKPKGRP